MSQSYSSFYFKQANSLIVERARDLVERQIANRMHDKPPFLAIDYARLLGICEFPKGDLKGTSALLLRSKDSYMIKVNEKHHPVRQNFSIAHEIGHILYNELFLDKYIQNVEYRNYNPQATRKIRYSAKERLCDNAAAELLMPEQIFKKYLTSFGLSINSIEPLAHIFRTSIQATALRIAEVSNEPCLMLMWRPFPENNPKGLKLKRCISSETRIKAMPVHNLDKFSSNLGKAYESKMSVKSNKKFFINNIEHFIPMESKGFGRGEYGYVLSLAFLNKIKLGVPFAE